MALPTGTFRGTADGRSYIVSKTSYAQDKAWKLVAEELGGADYISLNYYLTERGENLRPCEMPEAKVTEFVMNLRPA